MPQFKLGRNRPPIKRKMCLHDYRLPTVLPTPPDECSWAPRATPALRQVYLNNELGDCVIAGIAHLVGVFTGNAGQTPEQFTVDQITQMYSAIGGYNPNAPLDADGNNPTDQGCDERTAMAYWQQQGAPAPANKISGWVSIDGTQQQRVKTALWLFENLVFGVELPDKWVNPFPSTPGFVWDVEGPANPDNGHCFVGVGYTQSGVVIDSWGMLGTITWTAIIAYATATGSGELYSVLSPQVIAKAQAKAPNGYDWEALQADFAQF
jgi:hypothetical protein